MARRKASEKVGKKKSEGREGEEEKVGREGGGVGDGAVSLYGCGDGGCDARSGEGDDGG